MTRLPLVGVTGTTEMIRGRSRVRVNEAYTRAVERAGMIPVVLPPLGEFAASGQAVGALHGLVLTGGEDVDPRRYGAARHPAADLPHEIRDASELALLSAARQQRTPVLAICRGLQIVNVALGGTLVQDLPTERPDALPHDPGGPRDARVHAVRVDAGSRLARALGATELTVNSSHHQSILSLAPSLVATGRAPDGTVEGVETADEWWMIGVQWHPEELVDTPDPWDRGLFDAFREAMVSPSRPGARDGDRARATAGAWRFAPAASAVPASARPERGAGHSGC